MRRVSPGSRLLLGCLFTLSMCLMAVVATTGRSPYLNEASSNTQNTNSSRTPTKPRRPLPKPPSGPRRFEKYSGQDSSSRLTAAGATRETVNPRRPLAPLEGRAYGARPFFAWEMAPGSKSYHFAIYEGDHYKEPSAGIVYETDVTVTEFKYPQDAPELKPGKLYSWRVSTPTATGKDKDGSTTFINGVVATLVILAGADAAEIQKALATAGLTSPKTREDRLDQAIVFENYGIWYDALEIANELAQDPKDKDALIYYERLLDQLETKP